MADIFLSYASEDRDRVEPLVEALQTEGWDVWWDQNMHAGRRLDKVIDEALQSAACVVAVWSQHSVKSDFVIDETSEGRERGILVPILIDDVRPPLGFRAAQTANLIGWPEQTGEFASLLSGIRDLVGDPTAESQKAVQVAPTPIKTKEP
jgi:sulfatase modifying factor 1